MHLAAAIPGVEPEGGGGRSDVIDVYKSPSPKNNISPQEASITPPPAATVCSDEASSHKISISRDFHIVNF